MKSFCYWKLILLDSVLQVVPDAQHQRLVLRLVICAILAIRCILPQVHWKIVFGRRVHGHLHLVEGNWRCEIQFWIYIFHVPSPSRIGIDETATSAVLSMRTDSTGYVGNIVPRVSEVNQGPMHPRCSDRQHDECGYLKHLYEGAK